MIKRIGFACKLSELHPTKGAISIPEHNTQTTTLAWLNRQTKTIAVEKLWNIVKHNINATKKLVSHVGEFPLELRMVRLSSDILPMYTHNDWSWFYQDTEFVSYAENHFATIGKIAKEKNVRLSMHPGQFVVLSSINDNIVNRSIEEFEYHADMARWMGYGVSFQDFKINVHISGKRGPAGIRSAVNRLSTEARNCITIENDEMSWGIEASLELAEDLALVLDLHHHWIATGEYIDYRDDRIKRIQDSWRGCRPVVHYSTSREDVLVGHDANTRPDLSALVAAGYKKQKLRAHSDFAWNRACNEWALSHNDWADLMVEAKGKNLASQQLYEQSLAQPLA